MVTEEPDGRGRYDRSLSKRERAADRHQRLLAAAAEVFVQEGYANATLAKIVTEAGVGRRTFYDHFADLDQCLSETYEHAIAVVFRDVGAGVDEIDDPMERLRLGIANYLALVRDNASFALLTRNVVGVDRAYVARRDAAYVHFAKLIERGVAHALACGIVSRAPDHLTAYALVGAIEATAFRYLDRDEADRIMEAGPTLMELVLRTFL